MQTIEKERFVTQLTAPDFRLKEGKCYDSSELNMRENRKVVYHNHLIRLIYPDGTDSGCACGKYSEEQVKAFLMGNAWSNFKRTIHGLENAGLIR
jgi:hypothetical protein